MAHKDWIPSREQDFVDLCEEWLVILANGAKVIGFDWDPAVCNATLQTIAAFINARNDYKQDNNSTKRIIKDRTKHAAEDAMRSFANSYVRFNDKMRDEDKEPLGITPRDVKPTPQPVPEAKPETEAQPSGKGRHTVTAVNPATQKKNKPDQVTGVVFAYRVRPADEPRSKASQMPCVSQASTTRNFQWDEDDYGKEADYATAYETATGKRGPWSDVVSLLIS